MCSKRILEIACFNLESAVIAEKSGADRIELCENYSQGGLTPSHELIKKVRALVEIPLHVIVRPKGGDFVYTDEEILKMERDILFCKDNEVNGIVFGVLTKENQINVEVCKRLVSLAQPLSVTFHRAIDECPDQDKAFKILEEIGVNRVLTSGGKGNAIDNLENLKKLQAEYNRTLMIMPGGSIRSANISGLITSGCFEYHSAALTGTSELADPLEIKKLKNHLTEAS